MIFNEKQLFALKSSYPKENTVVMDLIETCLVLWKVARAARRWQKALPGVPSVNAEIEMIERLDEVKEELIV